eukprot:CAMPEP_0184305978 /NCGR_PEP_ID=MMETSP1049-20130417/15094_1 /TAXON_ID=77928 /ORGANISM="Proteomonas sulcata, Strain CCMP704" /LENGTH=502 /DNA_ID=CAMNT_0026618143 /DNA_START=105 /DNA_END=1613 /DNA_ORIENTATION=+
MSSLAYSDLQSASEVQPYSPPGMGFTRVSPRPSASSRTLSSPASPTSPSSGTGFVRTQRRALKDLNMIQSENENRKRFFGRVFKPRAKRRARSKQQAAVPTRHPDDSLGFDISFYPLELTQTIFSNMNYSYSKDCTASPSGKKMPQLTEPTLAPPQLDAVVAAVSSAASWLQQTIELVHRRVAINAKNSMKRKSPASCFNSIQESGLDDFSGFKLDTEDDDALEGLEMPPTAEPEPVGNEYSNATNDDQDRQLRIELNRSCVERMKSTLVENTRDLVSRLSRRMDATPFNEPVDPAKYECHDYHQVIKTPMDLGTIKTRLHLGKYHDFMDVFFDVELTFRNAMVYNPPGHIIHTKARKLLDSFSSQFISLLVSKRDVLAQYVGDLRWRLACAETLKSLWFRHESWPFLQPVDPVALQIPDYPAVIQKPMDLGTVGLRLKTGFYQNPHGFDEDVRLVMRNAMTYNPPGHPVHEDARRLLNVYEEAWPLYSKELVLPNASRGSQ